MQISRSPTLLNDAPGSDLTGYPVARALHGAKPQVHPRGRVWTIGGGKGGVGKSLLTASVGITLAQTGKRVCVIDADLGGANLHSCLGVTQPVATLHDFVTRQSEGLEELAVQTPVPNLSLISGAGHVLGAANPDYQTKMRLIRKIKLMDFDHVLLDLGAGTGFNTLDFFLSGDLGILMCVPEPTSIDNLYRFIKAAFFRRLRDLDQKFQIRELVQAAMAEHGSTSLASPHVLFERITKLEPERGALLQEAIQRFRPKLVVNQVRSGADAVVGPQIAMAARNYFGIDLQFVGYLRYEDSVWRAVRKRRPLLLEYPMSSLAGSLRAIVTKILTS